METTMQTEMAALAPPEALAPVAEDKAADIVPLAPDITAKIDRQIASYMEAILTEDLHSQGFREKMDSAFRLGREEISNAASLMTGRFMERNFVGIENSAAFQSIQDMRGMLDQLNPGNQGDLLAPNMLWGLIPLGNKLRAYFRKFQSAGDQLKIIMGRIDAACDDMRRDAAEIEQVKSTREPFIFPNDSTSGFQAASRRSGRAIRSAPGCWNRRRCSMCGKASRICRRRWPWPSMPICRWMS